MAAGGTKKGRRWTVDVKNRILVDSEGEVTLSDKV